LSWSFVSVAVTVAVAAATSGCCFCCCCCCSCCCCFLMLSITSSIPRSKLPPGHNNVEGCSAPVVDRRCCCCRPITTCSRFCSGLGPRPLFWAWPATVVLGLARDRCSGLGPRQSLGMAHQRMCHGPCKAWAWHIKRCVMAQAKEDSRLKKPGHGTSRDVSCPRRSQTTAINSVDLSLLLLLTLFAVGV
jgi:hypothetical protein